MPPPPPRLANRGNFCLAREGVRGRVPLPGGEGGRTGFLPALSGLASNSPPPAGSRELGLRFERCSLMAWDRREEGTPVGLWGSGRCQESEDSSPGASVPETLPGAGGYRLHPNSRPLAGPSSFQGSMGDILGQYYPPD